MAEECEGSEHLILLLTSVVASTAEKELMSLHELQQESQAYIFLKSASLTSTEKPETVSSFMISNSETRQLTIWFPLATVA